MKFRHLVIGIAGLTALVLCGCSGIPRGAATIEVPIVPSEISDFTILYAQNCSGCHGPEGKGGAAIALGDPVYLAIADDATVRRVTAGGGPGRSMPAFPARSGGMLPD